MDHTVTECNTVKKPFQPHSAHLLEAALWWKVAIVAGVILG